MYVIKKTALALTCAVLMSGVVTGAQAANWTMLQGTEPAGNAPRIKVWGFIQPVYEKDTSKENKYVGTPGNNFEMVPPKLLGPDFGSQEGFNIRRARLGARGTGLPLDSNVSYFFLAEFGNNAITHGGGGSAKITDASITLNHIPGARVRMGTFKVPTTEEGYQAIHVFDYINFTDVANQMMLERFPNKQWTPNRNNTAGFAYTDGDNETPFNGFDRSVSAFRDTGLQVFDSFLLGDWDTTYAVMYGNGNGMNLGDNDDNKDVYLYLSTEWVFGGKGPRRQGWKFFVWQQDGKRTLYNPDTPRAGGPGTDNEPGGKQEYDRKRYGLGTKFNNGLFRVTAEYLKGEGMIFLGPDNPTFTQTAPTGAGGCVAGDPDLPCPLLADGRDGESAGYYIDLGWYIPNTAWELDVRYDFYDRLTNAEKLAGPCAFNFEFKTLTVGTNYHFNKKSRVTVNVAQRNYEAVECPDAGPGGNPNNNLEGVDMRYGVQLTHIF